MFKKVRRFFSEGNESELLPLCFDEPSTSTARPTATHRQRSYGSFKPFWSLMRSTFSFAPSSYQVKSKVSTNLTTPPAQDRAFNLSTRIFISLTLHTIRCNYMHIKQIFVHFVLITKSQSRESSYLLYRLIVTVPVRLCSNLKGFYKVVES